MKDNIFSNKCEQLGKGWWGLLDNLSNKISEYHDIIDVRQVKEKFGTLRIYCDINTDNPTIKEHIQTLIIETEKSSSKVCESCGCRDNVNTSYIKNWYITLCSKCLEERIKKEMIKVIFLDCDYVLNDESTEDSYIMNGIKYTGVDDDKVAILKRIVEQTNAKLVISSSWRNFPIAMEYLKEKLGKYLSSQIIGTTPRTGVNRYYNIKSWLDDRIDILVYAVIDDIILSDMFQFEDAFFLTDKVSGLTDEIADKIISHLNKV